MVLDLNETALWLGAVASIIVSLGVIYAKVIKPMVGAVRTVSKTYDEMQTVLENTKQLQHNGGSHLRDEVAAVAKQLDDVKVQVERNNETGLANGAAMAAHIVQSDLNQTRAAENIAALWRTLAQNAGNKSDPQTLNATGSIRLIQPSKEDE
jgi:hypothetical protein